MRVLILEDEIPAYKKLNRYLNEYFSESVTHDWVRSVVDAKQKLASNAYDVILSDIQLLDGLSFDVFDAMQIDSPIIFCSAYDEYLFQAFATNGIAYILKPYTPLDFNQALDKYLNLFKKEEKKPLDPTTLQSIKEALQVGKTSYKKRFVVKKTKGIFLLNTIDISVIYASGDFCTAIDCYGKQHTISEKIGGIIDTLDPAKFFRVNRSQIIHIEHLITIENHFKNKLSITMKGCNEKIMTSAATTPEFRKWIEA